MWLDHLESVREHRKAGAKKAAETRRKKRLAKEHDKESGNKTKGKMAKRILPNPQPEESIEVQ